MLGCEDILNTFGSFVAANAAETSLVGCETQSCWRPDAASAAGAPSRGPLRGAGGAGGEADPTVHDHINY